ncbi:MAG: hypothetical protein ACI4LR_04420 [Treponema sp.]|nr:hypothetical protein [Treponema sp.]
MKKVIILFAMAFLLVFASCKSTPEAEPVLEQNIVETPQEPEKPAEEAVKEALPEESKPVPDFSAENQQGLEKLEKARKAAADAKAAEILPEQYGAAEKKYSDRKDYVAEHFSTESFSSEMQELTAMYEAIAEASLALGKKQQIEELGLSQYNKNDWTKAETALSKLQKEYEAGANSSQLLATAKTVNESYSKVLLAGLNGRAKKARVSAITAKKKADSVYAGVSQKAVYKSYADKIVKADSALVTRNPEEAYKGYKDAEESFTKLYESVSKKRAEAQAKIEKARAAVEKSESYATEADTIAPLKSAVAGIEDENSTLLEQDEYKDPESAVIDVDSTEMGKAAAEIEAEEIQEGEK